MCNAAEKDRSTPARFPARQRLLALLAETDGVAEKVEVDLVALPIALLLVLAFATVAGVEFVRFSDAAATKASSAELCVVALKSFKCCGSGPAYDEPSSLFVVLCGRLTRCCLLARR